MSERELVANVAHQLKTPLAVIRGYAELLDVRDDDATRHEAATQIREAADVLDLMLDDLLIVFAVEADVLPVDPEPLDLAAAALDVIERLSIRLPGHSFTTRLDSSLPARGDPEHVERIISTLLLNACGRSPEGGEVEVAGRDTGDSIGLSVSDSGLELSDEELEAAFERHRPSTAVRSELRSSGLELYKVRRLVELHGGSVQVETVSGRGSTFGFTLPR